MVVYLYGKLIFENNTYYSVDAYKNVIELHFNRKDFEEIYFRNKHGNFILSPMLKGSFITFIIFLAVFCCTVTYSYLTNKNAWLIVIASILTLITFIPYFIKVLQLKKWRTSVLGIIHANEKYKQHKLLLTDSTLTLVQDGTEQITKWSAFTHAEISNDYLTLTSSFSYVFPKKSMTLDEYDYLSREIKLHLNSIL